MSERMVNIGAFLLMVGGLVCIAYQNVRIATVQADVARMLIELTALVARTH